MRRQMRIDQIRRRLGERVLVWVGTRGTDAESLADFPDLVTVFCQTCAPSEDDFSVHCLEVSSLHRVDLNRYDISKDRSTEANLWRAQLIAAVERPSVVVGYRAMPIISSACMARADVSEHWGMFHLRQACFEHKPWLEGRLEAAGIRILPWRNLATDQVDRVLGALENGPVVLRRVTGSGGAAITVARSTADVSDFFDSVTEAFFSLSRYLYPSIPLSVSAVVFPDGRVSVFPPSLQLIGLEQSTHRSLGFCGNDFVTAGEWSRAMLDQIEHMAVEAGKVIHGLGYLGTFGVDALIYEDDLFLVEVNARFLASCPLIAQAARQAKDTDPYLEHMAAYAGLEPIPRPPLHTQLEALPLSSHIVVYNRGGEPIRRKGDPVYGGTEVRITELPALNCEVEQEAEMMKVIVHGSVSRDGHQLNEAITQSLRDWTMQWLIATIP